MNSFRHFTSSDVDFYLDRISDDIMSQYNTTIEKNDNQYDSHVKPSFTLFPSPHTLKYDCFIGTRRLFDHEKDGYVRDKDFVWCVKHMFHEEGHMYRSTVTYQQPLSSYYLDMARMEAISSVFGGYKDDTYWYRPSELDADLYAMEKTVKYFDSFTDSKGTPFIDARSCITDIVKTEYQNSPRYRNHNIETYSDVIQTLQALKNTYQYVERPRIFTDKYAIDVEHAEQLMDIPQWRAIITDTQRKGINYDRKLFAMSLDVNDQWVKFHAGLREEARLVSKEYPRQLSGLSLSKLLPFTDTDEISL